MSKRVDDEPESFYAKNHWPAMRGSKNFIEKAHLRSNAGRKYVTRARKIVRAQAILAAVAAYFKCDKKDLLTAKRGGGVDNTGRALAMKLCQESGNIKLADMAKLFNVGSDSTVSRTITNFTELLLTDRKLEALFDSITQDSSP